MVAIITMISSHRCDLECPTLVPSIDEPAKLLNHLEFMSANQVTYYTMHYPQQIILLEGAIEPPFSSPGGSIAQLVYTYEG